MPINRVFSPKPSDIIYHYCSIEAFHSICQNRTIRFSDINMMNDHLEERWGYRVFEDAATVLLNDKDIQTKHSALDKEFFDKVDSILAPMQLHAHPVISCFSKAPDVLSQWRAYADDGHGFVVGFSAEALKAMPITLLEVLYDPEKQILEMKAALLAAYLENLKASKPFDKGFVQWCQLIGFYKIGFKNPAFSEEMEIRCLHALAVERDDGRPRLVNDTGIPVHHRVSNRTLVAYVDLPLPDEAKGPIIKEVWLGPRNQNGLGNIVYFMSECGFKDYTIRHSAASYR